MRETDGFTRPATPSQLRGQGSLAHGSAPLKIILPKGLKEELAGKTVTARIKVKVKNAAGATIDKTITVRIKMKAAH
jgi:hypothetical protein